MKKKGKGRDEKGKKEGNLFGRVEERLKGWVGGEGIGEKMRREEVRGEVMRG